MTTEINRAEAILGHYEMAVTGLSRIATGLVNLSYLVESASGQKYVLQKLNPVFPAEINLVIDVVTRHLKRKGLVTPELICTAQQQLWVEEEGETWRVLSHIDGDIQQTISSQEMAHEAGALLGRFHTALQDLKPDFDNFRQGVHHLARHITALRETLENKMDHPEYVKIVPIADEILTLARQLPTLPQVEKRIVHGDPKVTNIVFANNSNRAVCLIDLDTVAKMPIYLDLGDAIRSWCNPGGEDTENGMFALDLFSSAIQAYAIRTESYIEDKEWTSIVPATLTIYIELAARFCADALNEEYFAWNPDRFHSRSDHNKVRAIGQLNAAKSLTSQYKEAEEIVLDAFSQ